MQDSFSSRENSSLRVPGPREKSAGAARQGGGHEESARLRAARRAAPDHRWQAALPADAARLGSGLWGGVELRGGPG